LERRGRARLSPRGERGSTPSGEETAGAGDAGRCRDGGGGRERGAVSSATAISPERGVGAGVGLLGESTSISISVGLVCGGALGSGFW
jgi:hypothetical protein